MNILLITGPYPPEIRAISFMMQELAEELSLRGHNVTAVTYSRNDNSSCSTKKRCSATLSIENGVRVIRIKAPSCHKGSYIMRGIAQLSLPYLFWRGIRRFVKEKIKAVIVYSPPLPLTKVGIKVKKFYGATYLLNIQDIFPQNAIDLGLIRNTLVIKLFERMEQKAYKYADKITSHTESSTKFLIERKHIPPEKITTVSNWLDLEAFKKAKPTGMFREKYGLKDKFVFLFAGIMGPSQNLEFIIQVARRVADIPEICFFLVGDGTEKANLQNMVETYRLQNVKFHPFVSKEEYPSLAKEADVGLVCLSSKNITPVIPGKILGFMASALPVVAFLHKESDGHILIREARCGYSLISDDYQEAAKLVRKVFSEKDLLAQYGQNGYNYVVKHFSKKVCIDKLEQLIL